MAKFVEQAGAYLRYSRNCTSGPTVGGGPSTPTDAGKWQDRVRRREGRQRSDQQASECATHGKADNRKLRCSPVLWEKPLFPHFQVCPVWTGAALANGDDEVGKAGMRMIALTLS